MAEKLAEYDGAGVKVSAYQLKVQGFRTSFVVTFPEGPMRTFVEGEYSDLSTRERRDPGLGLVYREGSWRKDREQ